jgi:AcrR family transcriptional regulator
MLTLFTLNCKRFFATRAGCLRVSFWYPLNMNEIEDGMKQTKTSTTPRATSAPSTDGAAPAPCPDASANYHHGDLRNALIAAGRAALEDIGPRELSLRSVAKAVGVSEAAPSRHFAGKEGLLAAMAAQGFAELAEKRREVAESNQPPEARVRAMMDEYVRFAQRHRGLFDLMVGPRIIQPGKYDELKQSTTASFDLFAQAVCDFGRVCGWPDRSLNLLVHAAWAVEHGLATLILGSRAPVARWAVAIDDMIRFSISLFIDRVSAGPGES